MYCSKCGSEITGNEKFCPTCGNSLQSNASGQTSNGSMSAKTTSIIAYITWVGFIVAMCAGDREGAKFHLNQALVYHIFCLLSAVPVVGFLWGIFMLVCFILGLVWASQGEEKELPLIGKIHILN